MGAVVLWVNKEKGLELSQATSTASLPIPGDPPEGLGHSPSLQAHGRFQSSPRQEESGGSRRDGSVGCCHCDMIGQTLGTGVVQENRAMGAQVSHVTSSSPNFLSCGVMVMLTFSSKGRA